MLVVVALLTVLGLAADFGWQVYTRPRWVVSVEGHLVGALRHAEDARSALESVLAEIPPDMRALVNLDEKLSVQPAASDQRLATTTVASIKTALVKSVPSLAYATAITINGKDTVAVADVKAAEAVRDSILAEYRSTVLTEADSVEQLKFQESIDWHPKIVPSERVRTVEEAIGILKYGTDQVVMYTVREGDTGWAIARSYNVTAEQLATANPNANLESLQIGQVLNVTFREPHVHMQSITKKVVLEDIPFTEEVQKDSNLWPWQYQVSTPGIPGSRELTIREYRENGRVVKSEVLENKVLKEPKTQIARQGTKQVPAMGTGALVYPVNGVLTSCFCDRWGAFHEGIDIAAPSGTPVLAADSGVVVFRGWSGNYGNLIQIDHGGGNMTTWYGHLSAFKVSVGDTVKKGQVIGLVGNTGYSTGPHLHYEVHVGGSPVNPLNYYD